MHRGTFQSTSIAFLFIVNWLKVTPYYWLGQRNTENLLTSAMLLPIAPIGVTLGRRIHERINDAIFYAIVHAGLFVIGVKLLYDASRGL